MPPFEDNYIYDDRPVKLRACECPGCPQTGEYRAPKNRELSAYYWFCLDHVRDYNRQWDYYAGMSTDDIEKQIRNATVWERPSWPLGNWKLQEQKLRDQINREFFGDGRANEKWTPPMPKAEQEALAALELMPPVTYTMIKAQYRVLVKRHHPDANGGSMESEEKFKAINQAFTTLKQIYGEDEVA